MQIQPNALCSAECCIGKINSADAKHSHINTWLFFFFLVPAQRTCSQNHTECADSQFPIRSPEYSSGEGKWRLEIIGTGSWWGSLNDVGNGSREGRSKEWSIVGEKKAIQESAFAMFLSFLVLWSCDTSLWENSLCKTTFAIWFVNATSTLAFSEKYVHLHSVR